MTQEIKVVVLQVGPKGDAGASGGALNPFDWDDDFTAVAGTVNFVDSTAKAIGILMDDATTCRGRVIEAVLVAGDNDITFNTQNGQTLAGRASGALYSNTIGTFYRFVSDGANWQGQVAFQ